MENNTSKSCCWGCIGMFFIAVGILELIFSIVTFNIILFLLAIISTFSIMIFIGGKIKEIDKEEKESDNNEVVDEEVE